MLEDLIIAAFADAKSKADRAAAEKMQSLTAGLPAAAGHEIAVLRCRRTSPGRKSNG